MTTKEFPALVQFRATPLMFERLADAAEAVGLNQSVLLREICESYLTAADLKKESTNERERERSPA